MDKEKAPLNGKFVFKTLQNTRLMQRFLPPFTKGRDACTTLPAEGWTQLQRVRLFSVNLP